MTAAPFTIGLIQMQMSDRVSDNIARATRMLEQAAAGGVQVACLPELFNNLYFCQTLDQAHFNFAEPLNGPTVAALSAVAKKCRMAIVGSIYEKAAPGLYYNTAVMIENDGSVVGHYRKMQIPHDPLFEEKYYFAPGDLGYKAFDTRAGKIGTLVCWDQWYPEAARLTALQGAGVLFYPTAIGWHPAEKAEFGEAQVSAWETIQRSHAIANGVYVAAVNRIGHEVITATPARAGEEKMGGIEFFGHSFIADPFGRILAMGSHDKEEILTAAVDPALIEYTRRNWPFLRDRRIDSYGGITGRWNAA
jgi:N-carbamoylputrescine amidase